MRDASGGLIMIIRWSRLGPDELGTAQRPVISVLPGICGVTAGAWGRSGDASNAIRQGGSPSFWSPTISGWGGQAR